ncbi:hypothetical protein EYF80_066257 [Liparis tanakae]|uniref:Uncharacterized protein n=1 Tax=Liparis tanakae TaxID=230148 RepID=A0A4Z2E4F9_9TELE|nr:hypothetical protein EYF80_066257 [Liparis tanakae]
MFHYYPAFSGADTQSERSRPISSFSKNNLTARLLPATSPASFGGRERGLEVSGMCGKTPQRASRSAGSSPPSPPRPPPPPPPAARDGPDSDETLLGLRR